MRIVMIDLGQVRDEVSPSVSTTLIGIQTDTWSQLSYKPSYVQHGRFLCCTLPMFNTVYSA